jgi:phosphodiesterase/alkaline phosphatase D-like protein
MTQIFVVLMGALTAGALFSPRVHAQLNSPGQKATRVQITEGPSIELVRDNWAIITWTSNNPGGSPEHFAVVHYGKAPTELSQTAKSHIRLNPGHSHTVFRVRVTGLEPHTTYYYSVDSEEPNGTSNGVKSPVKTFSTQ